MKLEQYVSEILGENKHSASFPAALDIPKSLVDYCWNLYQDGEKGGRERGVNLYLKGGKLLIGPKVFIGDPTGIDIAVETDNENFGDLHCHPSSSVGHVNGYSAHSAQDFQHFQSHLKKPVFIRFVASGTRIYAAINRDGHSNLNLKEIGDIGGKTTREGQTFFDKHCPTNKATRDKAINDMDSNQEIDHYLVLRRRDTPGLGKEMESLSIRDCKEIARRGNFGFYMADQGWGISVWYWEYLQLKLQR
jgi:hypothetical protein